MMNARHEMRSFYCQAYRDARLRAAADLLNEIPSSAAPRRIVDLGCEAGYATELLVQRFPEADIIGIDHSEEALRQAQARLPRIPFGKCDIGHWSPTGPFDLIFSNGAMQTLPRLRQRLPKLLSLVAEGGRLAVQIPNNLQEPNRALMRMVAADGPWAKKLLPIAKSRPFNETCESLYASIGDKSASLDIWETTYIHLLDGIPAVVEWMKATSLEPFLSPLDETERRSYLERYAAELTRAYPVQDDGKVLLRFPRMFFLARR